MSYKNIDVQLSEEDKDTIISKFREVDTLIPFAVKLSAEDRRKMASMGKKTIGFVEHALGYATTQPQLIPNYVDLDQKKRDMIIAVQLVEILSVLNPVREKLRDTLMVAGGEAYLSARVIYDAAKMAVKSGLPGSESVAKDLGSIFKRPRKKTEEEVEQTATKKKVA
jgi:hypothetical protein